MEMDADLSELLNNISLQEEYIPETEITISFKKIFDFPNIELPTVGERDDHGSWRDIPALIYEVASYPLYATLTRTIWGDKNYYGLSLDMPITWIDVPELYFKEYDLPLYSLTYYFHVEETVGKPFFILSDKCNMNIDEISMTDLLEMLENDR